MKKRITFTESEQDNTDNRITAYSDEPDETAGPSLFDLLHIWLSRRNLICSVVGGSLVLTLIILLLLPNQYRSTASILPSGPQDKMAELKALAGFGGLMASNENSSELFPVICRSNAITDEILSRTFSVADDDRQKSLTLSQYFDQDNQDKLRRALHGVVTVSADKKTGVISISAETEYPALSQAIVSAFISELEDFNLNKRRSQAKDNAVYLSREVEKARTELAAAEDSLEALQAANRNWYGATSPDLMKSLARLQRQVEIQTKKYLFLTQEYEIARLDIQKDVPIVRILDHPSLPTTKSSPKRLLILLGVGLFTLVASLFVTTLLHLIARRVDGPDRNAAENLQRELHAAFPRLSVLAQRNKVSVTE